MKEIGGINMDFRLNHSLANAQVVLSILNMIITKDVELKGEAWVECFDNCREQGYVIVTYKPESGKVLRVAFAENRNSDELVVYCYENTRSPSNLPDEKSWNDKKYFRYDAFYECAKYILERIKKHLEG